MLVVTVLLALAAVDVSAGAAAGAASISLTVEGEILVDDRVVGETTLSEGESITTSADPTVTFDIRADSAIELVSVRVDGETRYTYSPGTESFERQETLDLDRRANEVRIVVKANRTTTWTASIAKDNRAPLVTFESPFESGFVSENGSYSQADEEYTINDSRVTLAAAFTEQTSVTEVLIERRYRGPGPGPEPIYVRNRTTIEDPGDAIAHPLHLGPASPEFGDDGRENGTNTLRLTAFDRFDQRRVYEVDLFVEDDDPPEIDLHRAGTDLANRSVVVNFTASDRVGLQSVGYRRGDDDDDGLRYLMFGRQPITQPVRKTFTERIRVTEGTDSLTLVAEDTVGKVTNLTRFVSYDRLVTPQVRLVSAERIDESRVRVRGGGFDGRITRVQVELVDDDEILDIRTVYDGDPRARIRVDEALSTGSFPVTARLRVLDETGTEHTESVRISGEGFEPAGETSTTPTPTRTPSSASGTGTADPAPTPATPAGDPIVIRNASLSDREVSPGETVRVNATIANRGDGNTVYTAGLLVNDAVVATEPVTLPSGEERRVSFEYEVNETGTAPVAVNGTSAGTLTVGSGGILASVLGVFDPVVGLLGGLPLGVLRPVVLFALVPGLVVFLLLKGLATYLGY